MIKLLTGQPGHGKTLYAIHLGKQWVKEGRTVYALGIPGHKPEKTGFIECSVDDFYNWQEFPKDSCVIVDESYNVLPAAPPGKAVPEYIQKLAVHRHRGFDFLIMAQQTNQLHYFIKGLIETHIHVRRRFGTHMVALKEWDAFQSDTKTPTVRTTAWRLDKSLYDHYVSATQHTMKRRVPWYIYALPLAILATVGAFIAVPALFVSKANEIEKSATGAHTGPLGPGATLASDDLIDVLRNDDPARLLRPRVEGAPWTAPAFDGVDLGQPPSLMCMASESRCICLTMDQGTRWHVSEDVCRITARYGRYDPTRKPSVDRPIAPAVPAAPVIPQRDLVDVVQPLPGSGPAGGVFASPPPGSGVHALAPGGGP